MPIAACDPTPGCHVIQVDGQAICAAEDPAGCGALDERQCAQNPSCRAEFREICDGEPFPGDEDGDFAPEPFPQPCRVEFECVPDENGLPPCAQIDVDSCFDRRDCQVVEDPDCQGFGAPPPPDGADPIQPPQCLRCVSANPQPGECFELNEFMCNDREDCQWNFEFGPPPVPEDCGCPADEPDCGCGALIAPGGFCEPIPQQDCWDLNERACFDRDGCRWVPNDGEVPPPDPCACPEGAPDCGCAEPGVPIAPPQGGFCEPERPQGCWDFGDERNCQANGCEWRGGGEFCECFEGRDGEEICECWVDEGFCQEPEPQDFCANFEQDECDDIPECEWLEAMVLPCECPPGEDCLCPEPRGICQQVRPQDCRDLDVRQCLDTPNCRIEEVFPPCAEPCGMDDPNCEPVICEPIEICVPDEQPGRCLAMDVNTCEEQRGCEWIQGGGGCECFIGPDGQEICGCDDGGGFCQPADPEPNGCEGLPRDVCDAEPGCWAIDCDFVCQGDEACVQDCREGGGQDMCVSAEDICFGAPLELCEEIEVCGLDAAANQCAPNGR